MSAGKHLPRVSAFSQVPLDSSLPANFINKMDPITSLNAVIKALTETDLNSPQVFADVSRYEKVLDNMLRVIREVGSEDLNSVDLWALRKSLETACSRIFNAADIHILKLAFRLYAHCLGLGISNEAKPLFAWILHVCELGHLDDESVEAALQVMLILGEYSVDLITGFPLWLTVGYRLIVTVFNCPRFFTLNTREVAKKVAHTLIVSKEDFAQLLQQVSWSPTSNIDEWMDFTVFLLSKSSYPQSQSKTYFWLRNTAILKKTVEMLRVPSNHPTQRCIDIIEGALIHYPRVLGEALQNLVSIEPEVDANVLDVFRRHLVEPLIVEPRSIITALKLQKIYYSALQNIEVDIPANLKDTQRMVALSRCFDILKSNSKDLKIRKASLDVINVILFEKDFVFDSLLKPMVARVKFQDSTLKTIPEYWKMINLLTEDRFHVSDKRNSNRILLAAFGGVFEDQELMQQLSTTLLVEMVHSYTILQSRVLSESQCVQSNIGLMQYFSMSEHSKARLMMFEFWNDDAPDDVAAKQENILARALCDGEGYVRAYALKQLHLQLEANFKWKTELTHPQYTRTVIEWVLFLLQDDEAVVRRQAAIIIASWKEYREEPPVIGVQRICIPHWFENELDDEAIEAMLSFCIPNRHFLIDVDMHQIVTKLIAVNSHNKKFLDAAKILGINVPQVHLNLASLDFSLRNLPNLDLDDDIECEQGHSCMECE